MDDPAQLSEYGKILLLAIVGILLVCMTILLAKVLSPKKPNPEKLSTYECGEEALGTSWVQINPRFYVIALVFLLFDVELIFVFPWATVFGRADFVAADSRWGWFTLTEMGVFLGILVVGLVYVWKRGDISWIKPMHKRPQVNVGIPAAAYELINQKEYSIRDYRETADVKADLVSDGDKKQTTGSLGFRPKFKQ
ncbi:NADH-quinone oxidoreductase subunit A [Sphingobacterium oryzagri]|uniref:NADH-quinone oxidoreductase subunit A n=1 Tax=Sphingobacterium oryzagri TaxID=3025669 RepID=A0ABY7WIE7_9SPHI|nr:NADH-quinone oxidoreductase subunit A [Sphingobacterium sp. KACC 22765]WDF68065.1 NADH-quinone oxidoreductase subunit A [Sphingobacterium sp. KACC 22765]